MRSALVALLIFIWIPVILFKPHIGVLVWSWVSHMNPHGYTYGFARSFDFLEIVGGMTVLGMLLAREKTTLPAHPIIIAILLFLFWTFVTSMLAFDFTRAWPKQFQFIKVIAFALISAMVMQSPNRLKAFVYVMVASLLYIAVKGGLFTLLTGGVNRVQGAGGMMSDNNQLSMALAMLFPLSVWLANYPPHKLLKWPLIGAAVLVPLAAIGTHSRGGFVALAAVLFMMILKSKRRFLFLAIAIPMAAGAVAFMPDAWVERMQTTEDATEDDSFMGRVSMWKYSSNLTGDHPIEGGGFNVFYIPYLAPQYMPPGYRAKAPHSIYFEVLGEHGYVGLLLFLTTLFAGWYSAGTNARLFRPYEETRWIGDMNSALQLSFIGYAVGGLTVNIATFDFFYHLLITVVLCRVIGDRIVEKGNLTRIAEKKEEVKKNRGKWKPPKPATRPQPAERVLS